jgi:hypothetical protein
MTSSPSCAWPCLCLIRAHISDIWTVTAALTATPSSDLNTQVGSYRDKQEDLYAVSSACNTHKQAGVEEKGTEIHKRLRMQNTGGERSLLIPVQARVGKQSRTKSEESQ